MLPFPWVVKVTHQSGQSFSLTPLNRKTLTTSLPFSVIGYLETTIQDCIGIRQCNAVSAEESVEATRCHKFSKESLMPVMISLCWHSAHIIVASMELLSIQSVTNTPSEIKIPLDILENSKDERKEVLDHVVGVIINTFVDINTVKYQTPQTSDSDTEVTLKGQACQNTISDDEGEDMGEEMECESDTGEIERVSNGGKGNTPKKDDIFRYGCELLTLGLLYSEYSDAIKEGAGPREFRCF